MDDCNGVYYGGLSLHEVLSGEQYMVSLWSGGANSGNITLLRIIMNVSYSEFQVQVVNKRRQGQVVIVSTYGNICLRYSTLY